MEKIKANFSIYSFPNSPKRKDEQSEMGEALTFKKQKFYTILIPLRRNIMCRKSSTSLQKSCRATIILMDIKTRSINYISSYLPNHMSYI